MMGTKTSGSFQMSAVLGHWSIGEHSGPENTMYTNLVQLKFQGICSVLIKDPRCYL